MPIPAEVQQALWLLVIAAIGFIAWLIQRTKTKQEIELSSLKDESKSESDYRQFVLDMAQRVDELSNSLIGQSSDLAALKAENAVIKEQRKNDEETHRATLSQLNQLEGRFTQSEAERVRLFNDNRALSEQKVDVAIENARLQRENEEIKAINAGYKADLDGALAQIQTLKSDLAACPSRTEFLQMEERVHFLEGQHNEYNRLSSELLKTYVDIKKLQEAVNKKDVYIRDLISRLTANGIPFPPAEETSEAKNG